MQEWGASSPRGEILTPSEATVPKMTGHWKAYGGAYLACPASTWPATTTAGVAERAVMGAEAVNIIHRREIAAAECGEGNVRQNSSTNTRIRGPLRCGEERLVDDVIEPSESRPKLIRALNVLASSASGRLRRSTETSRCELSPSHARPQGQEQRGQPRRLQTRAYLRFLDLVVNRCIELGLDRQDIHDTLGNAQVMPIRAEDGRFQTLSQVTDHSGTPRSSSNAGPRRCTGLAWPNRRRPTCCLGRWCWSNRHGLRPSTTLRFGCPQEDAPSRAECCILDRFDDDGQGQGQVSIRKRTTGWLNVRWRAEQSDFQRLTTTSTTAKARGVDDADHGQVPSASQEVQEVHVKYTVLKQGQVKFGLIQHGVVDWLDDHGPFTLAAPVVPSLTVGGMTTDATRSQAAAR